MCLSVLVEHQSLGNPVIEQGHSHCILSHSRPIFPDIAKVDVATSTVWATLSQ